MYHCLSALGASPHTAVVKNKDLLTERFIIYEIDLTQQMSGCEIGEMQLTIINA